MKKFILEIQHEKGSATMLTNTPDLIKAIEEYKKRINGLFGKDKCNIIPHVIKAEIKPLTYNVEEEEK